MFQAYRIERLQSNLFLIVKVDHIRMKLNNERIIHIIQFTYERVKCIQRGYLLHIELQCSFPELFLKPLMYIHFHNMVFPLRPTIQALAHLHLSYLIGFHVVYINEKSMQPCLQMYMQKLCIFRLLHVSRPTCRPKRPKEIIIICFLFFSKLLFLHIKFQAN